MAKKLKAKKQKKREKYSLLKHGITSSMLGTWLECKQKAKLSQDRWTKTRTGGALRRGSMAHAVLEECYNQQQAGKKMGPKKVARIVDKIFNDFQDKEGKRWSVGEIAEFEMLWAQASAVLPAYFKHYKDRFKWVGVEQKFSVPLEVEGVGEVTLRGMRDGAFKLKKKFWLFETKTRARIDEWAIVDTLSRDLQVNVYLLSLWLESGKLPSGVLYNVIRWPGLKQKKDESSLDFRERIAEHIAKDPEHYFKRFEIVTDEEELTTFREELEGHLREIHEWVEAGRPTTMFANPCVGKYGMCQYVPLCFEGNTAPYVRRDALFPELE